MTPAERTFLRETLTDLGREVARTDVQQALHGEPHPGSDPALLEDCRILTRALATTWRWDREDSLPEGQLLGIAWLRQVRALMSRRHRPSAPRPTRPFGGAGRA